MGQNGQYNYSNAGEICQGAWSIEINPSRWIARGGRFIAMRAVRSYWNSTKDPPLFEPSSEIAERLRQLVPYPPGGVGTPAQRPGYFCAQRRGFFTMVFAQIVHLSEKHLGCRRLFHPGSAVVLLHQEEPLVGGSAAAPVDFSELRRMLAEGAERLRDVGKPPLFQQVKPHFQ